MTPSSYVVELCWPGGSMKLPAGQYLVGRSSACDIVIDEPRVSRRHAQVEVDGTDVHVVDLESRNGVFVNDRMVRRMQALSDGDVMLVGGAEITMQLVAAPAGRQVRRPAQAYVVLESAKEKDEQTRGKDAFVAAPITKTFDDLELIGRVAERALAAGHAAQAENMVEGHLHRVLDDVLRQREVSDATVDRAVGLGLGLARATHRGVWFDYTIDLLRARRVACNDGLLEHRQLVRKKVDRVDPDRIRKYVDTLRADGPTMEELRAAQRLQEFLATIAT